MPKKSQISEDKRDLIVSLHQEGKTTREIAKIVEISQSSVVYNIGKHKCFGSVQERPRSGRPKIDIAALEKKIKNSLKANAQITARQVHDSLPSKLQNLVNIRTIQRRLKIAKVRHKNFSSVKSASKITNRRNQISAGKRHSIVILYQMNCSTHTIAKRLGISQASVVYNVIKFKKTGNLDDLKRKGRPRITSTSDDRKIVMEAKRNRSMTASKLQSSFNFAQKKPISVATVKRRLAAKNLHGRVAKRVPLLRKANKAKRFEFAKNHLNWTNEDWAKVLWTDESKFELFGSKRRVYVRRGAHESTLEACTVPTVKHGGGSLMVWGSFCSAGVGDLIEIKGTMDQLMYYDILQKNAIPSGFRLIGGGFVFQQDNDPKHKSKMITEFLRRKEEKNLFKVMVWPPQSPDLNPIELLWDEVDRQLRERYYTSTKTMMDQISDIWRNLDNIKLKKLVDRMPRLCRAVYEAKGGYVDEKKSH